jgi:hypothetical protein
VKSSLCSGEIAAAVGSFTEVKGFDFTMGEAHDFTARQRDFTYFFISRRS